jgi:hypothetical protein
MVSAVKNAVSGIAYSAGCVRAVDEFVKLHDDNIGESCQLYIHYIPELYSGKEVSEFISHIDNINKKRYRREKIHITMLGYKTTGRGEDVSHRRIDGLIGIFLEAKYTPIGIDTKMASDYAEELDSNNINRKLYRKEEGEFSMYIDAVTATAYKSSYEYDKPVEMLLESGKYWNKYMTIKDAFSIIRS